MILNESIYSINASLAIRKQKEIQRNKNKKAPPIENHSSKYFNTDLLDLLSSYEMNFYCCVFLNKKDLTVTVCFEEYIPI